MQYTDAEAVTALAGHTSDVAAHHSRYTDSEAVAAVAASPVTGGLTVDGITITGGGTISGLADPTNNDEAATKQYVDSRMWWGSVSMSTGAYTDQDGTTDTIVLPTVAGTTTCSTNNLVCVHHNTTNFLISILIPASVPAQDGEPELGNLRCWGVAPGDNEGLRAGSDNGVDAYASDVNGGHDHCIANDATAIAAGGTACLAIRTTGLTIGSHTTYGAVCMR